MRTIKFRAWDEQAKVMHEDFRFIKSGNDGNDWIVFTSNSQNLQSVPHPFENPYFQQQFKIMQFTGLTDIDGAEIYEGDIVSVPGAGNCEVKICTWYGVTYTDSDGYDLPHADCASEQDYPTIIGNIYQNQELLK